MSFPVIKDVPTLINYVKSATKIFDRVLKNITILSVGEGKCSAELNVCQEHLNDLNCLHGGFLATLVDCISTFALMSILDGNGHVSIDIHISYLKSAKIGDTIVIEADTVKSGKTIAFLEVLISNKETGDLLVKASHTKYILKK